MIARQGRLISVRFVLTSLCILILSGLASAADFSVVQSCVENGYKAMTDRAGIVVAVLDGTDSQVLTFGTATRDQLFEIGSITKTFTANLLAQAVADHSIRLSDPIPAAYQKPGEIITYQNLTTHTSGIIAGNFPGYNSGNPLSPYEGITIPVFKDLYSKTPLASKPGQSWAYSNIGEALLGLILSEKSGMPYEEMVTKNIFEPLGMKDSYFHVPDGLSSRFPQGHIIINKAPAMAAPYWDMSQNALDPAGGIRSSIGDMIIYARANLIPQSSPLAPVVELSQHPLYQVKPGQWMAMNWFIDQAANGDVLWHHGATGGFNSVIAISQKRGQAVVALTNTASYVMDAAGAPDIDMSFADVAINCLK